MLRSLLKHDYEWLTVPGFIHACQVRQLLLLTWHTCLKHSRHIYTAFIKEKERVIQTEITARYLKVQNVHGFAGLWEIGNVNFNHFNVMVSKWTSTYWRVKLFWYGYIHLAIKAKMTYQIWVWTIPVSQCTIFVLPRLFMELST